MKPIVFAFALLLPLTACAQEMTAGDLLDLCNSPTPLVRRTCSRYILGIVQGVGLADAVTGKRSLFCVPEGVTEDRMMLVFLNVANTLRVAYPKDMELAAPGIVGAAMRKTFPCAGSR